MVTWKAKSWNRSWVERGSIWQLLLEGSFYFFTKLAQVNCPQSVYEVSPSFNTHYLWRHSWNWVSIRLSRIFKPWNVWNLLHINIISQYNRQLSKCPRRRFIESLMGSNILLCLVDAMEFWQILLPKTYFFISFKRRHRKKYALIQ